MFNFYHPLTKLRKGNDFTHVSLSTYRGMYLGRGVCVCVCGGVNRRVLTWDVDGGGWGGVMDRREYTP